MSQMMPPEAPPMGPPPGAGGGGLPPELMAALSQQGGPGGAAPDPSGPMDPSQDPAMSADQGPLLAGGPNAGMPEDAPVEESGEMSTVDHIRMAIEHLKEAFHLDEDDQRGAQTAGSLASLQKILGGEQAKDQKLTQALGG